MSEGGLVQPPHLPGHWSICPQGYFTLNHKAPYKQWPRCSPAQSTTECPCVPKLITASLSSFQAEDTHSSVSSTWIISAGSSPSVMISTWALPCRSLSRMAKARSRALLRSRMLDFPPHQTKMF